MSEEDNTFMSERHKHKNVIKEIKEKGLGALLSTAVSFAICPGDDIAASIIATFSKNTEFAVKTASLPAEDTFQPKIPRVSKKGEKLD